MLLHVGEGAHQPRGSIAYTDGVFFMCDEFNIRYTMRFALFATKMGPNQRAQVHNSTSSQAYSVCCAFVSVAKHIAQAYSTRLM